jgi:hypothetical protein
MEYREKESYQVYLLRAWRERPASRRRPAVWRFSLEDTRTRQRRGFATLEAMVAFLRARVAEEGDQDMGHG